MRIVSLVEIMDAEILYKKSYKEWHEARELLDGGEITTREHLFQTYAKARDNYLYLIKLFNDQTFPTRRPNDEH